MDENLAGISSLLSDFSTRMNELEERLRILKERIILISQTMLKQSDRINKDIKSIKESLSENREEIIKIKEMAERVVDESAEFARKEELLVLEKYIKMFEPLKFMTEEDVKKIVKKIVEGKDTMNVEE